MRCHWLNRYGAALLLSAGLYVALQMELGRFVALDEVFFKAAGREWAASGRFAAPEIDGIPLLDRPDFLFFNPPLSDIWFPQPPLYTFLFGVLVRLVGFGPQQCILFDALIHACLALLTYLTVKTFRHGVADGLTLATGVAVLPLGTIARPDELAMCFGMAGMILLLHPARSWGRVAGSGILFGLTAATMTGAAVLLGIIALVLMALEAPSPAQFIRAGLLWGLTATLILAAVIAPILLAFPDAYKQYTTHVGDQFGRGRYLESYRWMWLHGKPYLALTVSCLVIAPISLTAARETLPRRQWVRLWAGPLLGLAFIVVCVPRKYFYLWFLGPWLLMAVGISLAQLASRRPATLRLAGLVILIGYLYAAGPFLKNTFAMLMLPPTQSLAYNAARIRALIPRGSVVMTDDYWWTLGNDCRVRDFFFSHPNPEEIDFIILTGSTTGDPNLAREVPTYLTDYVREHFVPIDNNINPQPVRVLGVSLPDTAFGFGVMVLGRSSREGGPDRNMNLFQKGEGEAPAEPFHVKNRARQEPRPPNPAF